MTKRPRQIASPHRSTFAKLLSWHLERGTRPSGQPDVVGKRWSIPEIADAVGISERQLRNWRQARNIPVNINSIERAFFGSTPAYNQWRADLTEAHHIAREEAKNSHTDLLERRYPLEENLTNGLNRLFSEY